MIEANDKHCVFVDPRRKGDAWDALWSALELALGYGPDWDRRDRDPITGEEWQYMGSWKGREPGARWEHQWRHRSHHGQRHTVKLWVDVVPLGGVKGTRGIRPVYRQVDKLTRGAVYLPLDAFQRLQDVLSEAELDD